MAKIPPDRRKGTLSSLRRISARLGLPRPAPHGDFSCDPSRWSNAKLSLERKNGMPAVMEEVRRRWENDD